MANENTFELTPEQKKLCHELTMETLRQNNALVLIPRKKGDPEDKKTRGYEEIGRSYFSVYEEFAYAIRERWESIQSFRA